MLFGGDGVDEWVFRRQHKIGRAEQRVWPRRKHGDGRCKECQQSVREWREILFNFLLLRLLGRVFICRLDAIEAANRKVIINLAFLFVGEDEFPLGRGALDGSVRPNERQRIQKVARYLAAVFRGQLAVIGVHPLANLFGRESGLVSARQRVSFDHCRISLGAIQIEPGIHPQNRQIGLAKICPPLCFGICGQIAAFFDINGRQSGFVWGDDGHIRECVAEELAHPGYLGWVVGCHKNLLCFVTFHSKLYLYPLTPADPVYLLRCDLVEIVNRVEILEQPVGVGGDLEQPLLLQPPRDRRTAALATAADHLFVRQADFVFGAPVDRDRRLIGQTALQELQKNPLRPSVVGRVGSVDLARPVKREPEHLELLFVAGRICSRHLGWMDAGLDGVAFGRQPERVPAEREEHVLALHAKFARHGIECAVAASMPDMQPFPRWIRKLNHHVRFWTRRAVLGPKGVHRVATFAKPAAPPLFFNLLMWVPVHGVNNHKKTISGRCSTSDHYSTMYKK